MLNVLRMSLGEIILLLFILTVLFNVIAKLFIDFITSFFKGKK